MDNYELAELIFPHIDDTPGYYEKKYPVRNLPNGAVVTRIGPSPTGFVHLGNLYNAIIAERLAHQSNGVFYLRIEDTDNKREVQGAVDTIINTMSYFGIHFDEGATGDGDKGTYGPYRQRQRKYIYQAFAKLLVQKGLAYPCFCTEEQLKAMRDQQIAQKENIGYYDKWAVDRNLTYEEIERRILGGMPYVLRFRSSGNKDNKVVVCDAIRGDISLQENYIDFILLKSDGIPTYHFAHVVDDHLMRTTHVIRGEEWLPSLPMHVQLFSAFGWQHPIYCHTAQLMKIDGTSKRKLSKRKDPELALSYYQSEGYVPEVVWNYLLTVLNSNYEEWHRTNPDKNYYEFDFSIKNMNKAGALFDLAKLDNISKEILARKDADYMYNEFLIWAKRNDPDFGKLLENHKSLAINAFSIERGGDNPRKDIFKWKQARDYMSFYFAETFKREDDFPELIDPQMRRTILKQYLETLDFKDDNSQWFEKIKTIAEALNFALQPKKYKKNPELYNGSITDVCNVIRVAMTGRMNTPDLWAISKVLGESETRKRFEECIFLNESE